MKNIAITTIDILVVLMICVLLVGGYFTIFNMPPNHTYNALFLPKQAQAQAQQRTALALEEQNKLKLKELEIRERELNNQK